MILLADGHSGAHIVVALDTSPSIIRRWKTRYEQAGFDADFAGSRNRSTQRLAQGMLLIVGRGIDKSPRDSGLVRSRWSGSKITLLWEEQHGTD